MGSQSLHKSGQFEQTGFTFQQSPNTESQSLHKSGQFGHKLEISSVEHKIVVAIPS